ncbi:NADH-quinone oxidoreductase subunit J [bacterium]|nr:MAG: NADH-quinone oxidoreductase subunit J [bacterium]
MDSFMQYFMINPVFYIFAGIAVLLAIAMLTMDNPVYSAIFMVLTFFCISVIYITLEAEFIAAIQVLVYTGAIMVLFLFVIMLLNLGRESDLVERSGPMKYISILLAFGILLQIGFAAKVTFSIGEKGMYPIEQVRLAGNTETIASLLFSQYVYPFEIASVLLLLGMVGAIIISKKKQE